MKKIKNFKLKSFTLAEVLITLGIIGIVAEITIPTLYQNFQDNANIQAWRNDYSLLSQAVTMATSDNSGDLTPYFSIYFSDCSVSNPCIDRVLGKYMHVLKYCSYPDTGSSCFPQNVSELNGTALSTGYWWLGVADDNDGGFIMANGANVVFDWDNTTQYAVAYVDVNGNKKPNKMGKDIYGFIIYKNRTIPMGSPIQDLGGIAPPLNETTCASNTSGLACSTTLLLQ